MVQASFFSIGLQAQNLLTKPIELSFEKQVAASIIKKKRSSVIPLLFKPFNQGIPEFLRNLDSMAIPGNWHPSYLLT